MDISNNIDLITLECLTNPGFYDKYNLKKNNPTQDKEFYDNVLDEILDISDNNFNNLISPNELLFNNANETKKITLDNFVVKHNPLKENIIYPEQKEINLKESSLKTKGIKPKKIKSTRIKSSVKKENIDKI